MQALESKKKKPFEYLVYDFIKITAGIPGLIWFRPKMWRLNDKAKQKIRGGAIVIANHIGFLDPIALMLGIWYRRHHFLCLKDFFAGRVSGWFFKQFHCIGVDRDNFSMATLRQVVDQLKDDRLVTMFPEGHLVSGGSGTDSFKSGMVLMSVMSKKPIVPVYIAPRKHFYSRLHLVQGEPVDIVGTYGPMPSLAQMEQITALLQEKEAELQAFFEERRKRK